MRAALAVLALLGTGACAQTFDATTLGVPVTMAAPAGEPSAGTAFKTSSHSVYGLFGLITFSQASLQKALSRQLVGASGVAQVKIKMRSRWSDLLITVLTAGIVVPRTVTFEGVVIGQ